MTAYVLTCKPTAMVHPELDSQLLQRIAAHDDAALRELYAAYGQRLYAYALRLSGDPASADDVVQETLVTVWRAAGKYRGEGRVLAWLLGIVHNLALKTLRRRPLPITDVMEATLPAPGESLETQAQVNDRARWVQQGMQSLSPEHRAVLACAKCQADAQLWQTVSREIEAENCALAAPSAVADRALEQVHASSRFTRAVRRAWQLLRAQAFLVHREMWPVSAAVMGLGVMVALVSGHMEFVYFVTPLVAAASLSMLSNQENDPAYELTIATPTSPWKVLLARLSVVSAYNLLLVLGATLALVFFAPPGLLGTLALGLLAPMAFLSALALLLSHWLGTGNAIALTYAMWIAQYVPYQSLARWMASPFWEQIIAAYLQFWQSPWLLLSLSALMLAATLWSAQRPIFRLGPGNE
jgi:RNA polymerase sigma factor (sigma-70 family)